MLNAEKVLNEFGAENKTKFKFVIKYRIFNQLKKKKKINFVIRFSVSRV